MCIAQLVFNAWSNNLAAELYGEADGSHATASEVAVICLVSKDCGLGPGRSFGAK